MKKKSVIKIISNCSDYCKQFGFSEKVIRRNPLYYYSAKKLFISLKKATFQERKSEIDKLLNGSLKCNTEHLKKFDASNFGIKALPLIDKKTIQVKPQDFLGLLYMCSIPSGTGGSTGIPLSLRRSFQSIVVEQAAIDSVYQMNNIEPLTSKVAVLRGDTVKDMNNTNPPYWKYNSNGKILYLSSHHLNFNTLELYLNELEGFSPDVIYAYPSAIELFANLVKQSDREFNVPLVVTSSEVFTSKSRLKVNKILSCVTCDYYGQAERISFAYSNKIDEYYFLPGYSHIELEFKYSEEQEDYYEIIGTSLWNNAMPIQRYQTGDLAVLPQDLTPVEIEKICYGVEPFYGILGRTSEYLISPEGQHLIGINQIPKFINNVVQMQFIQDAIDNVNIYVIPENNYSREDEVEIIKSARKKIPESVTIEVIIVTELEKTKAQKTPLLIRKLE